MGSTVGNNISPHGFKKLMKQFANMNYPSNEQYDMLNRVLERLSTINILSNRLPMANYIKVNYTSDAIKRNKLNAALEDYVLYAYNLSKCIQRNHFENFRPTIPF